MAINKAIELMNDNARDFELNLYNKLIDEKGLDKFTGLINSYKNMRSDFLELVNNGRALNYIYYVRHKPDNMIEMILYWCGLMLLALFSLLSAQLIMRSFFQNLSWGKHDSMLAIAGFGGSALLPLMLLSFGLLPSGIHQLTGLLLVYLATLPFDVWWLCRGRRMNLYAALLLACALKLGGALMLWVLVWLL